jgi:photosystem II stability/assembly factor-like uncharacterized protein
MNKFTNMRTNKIISLFFAFVLAMTIAVPSSVFAATAHSWVERLPNGDTDKLWTVSASDADGSFLMAGSIITGRLFTSLNGGVDWTERQPAGDTDQSWYALASDADGSNLIVGNGSRLYTSSNSGVDWTERQPAGDVDIQWNSAASDADGSNLIAANQSRLYTSSNGGVDWTERQPAGNADKFWKTVASDDDGSNLVAAVEGGRLYTSIDGGANWTERQPGGASDISWSSVASDADGSNLIVGIDFGRLYTSIDGGANWTERQPAGDINLPGTKVASDADGSSLFILGSSKLYSSDDGGVTWVQEQPLGNTFNPWTSVASDDDGTNFIATINGGFEGNKAVYTSPDNVAPTLATLSPEDDAVEVAVGGTFSISFNESVATSTGNITLKKTSDDSTIETIDVTSPKVTKGEADTIVIDPAATLDMDTEYYFLIDAGAIEDISGNSFAGISDPTIWSFRTDALPLVTSFSPVDNATGTTINNDSGEFYISFDQNIAAGTGNITLHKASDNTVVETFDVNDLDAAEADGSDFGLYSAISLDYETEYYFLVPAGAIEDETGNVFAGISDPTTWSFTTAPAPTFDFERVSVDGEGAEGNNGSSKPSISSDGRYVAFQSDATDLIPGDTNDSTDIFVYDRTLDTIERVSVDGEGAEGNNVSLVPDISSDGRYVAFQSASTIFVPGDGDTNACDDIFVYDRTLDTIERISVSSEGSEGNNCSANPSISSDGRYVAFQSNATDLIPGDTNDYTDIFVYDRTLDTIERVSVDSEGGQATGGEDGGASSNVNISSDGRYVIFQSFATNLVADDINDMRDVFIHDRETDATELVSVSSDEALAGAPSQGASVSSDGRYVVFSSSATNLTGDEVNGLEALFLRDRTLGTTELIPGAYFSGNGYVNDAVISDDGRYIVYSAYDESESNQNIYRYDTETNTEVLITEGTGIPDGGVNSSDPDISGDGSVIAFTSGNTDLVSGDTNSSDDIFVVEISGNDEDGGGNNGGDGSNNLGRTSGQSSGTAPTTSDDALRAQIQALIAQINALRAKLGLPPVGGSSPAGQPGLFTRNLTIGSTGPDVKALQIYLNTHGFILAITGPGSPGNETNLFGALTRDALAKFQAAKGISPAAGFFGPLTRAYVNAHP